MDKTIQDRIDEIFNQNFDLEKINEMWVEEVRENMNVDQDEDGISWENLANEDKFIEEQIQAFKNGFSDYAFGDKILTDIILADFAYEIDEYIFADEEQIAREILDSRNNYDPADEEYDTNRDLENA